jgi:hypothetical protein
MHAGLPLQNGRLSSGESTGLARDRGQSGHAGEACWTKLTRRPTFAPVSGPVARFSARSSSFAATKNSPSTCGATGYVGAAFASCGVGAAFKATGSSRTSTPPGALSANSTSAAASPSIRSTILKSAYSLEFSHEISDRRVTAPAKWPWTKRRHLPGRASERKPDRKRVILAAGIVSAAYLVRPAYADRVSILEFDQLACRCAPSVALSTLASIARTESGFQSLAINDNTSRTSGVPGSRGIAIQIASGLLESGHLLDIGLMQTNLRNFGALRLTLEPVPSACQATRALSCAWPGVTALPALSQTERRPGR